MSEENPDPPSPPPQLIVGVGASAGGLEALQALLSPLSPGCGLALLVVVHQDPATRGLLPEALAPQSRLPVQEARDGERPAADRVYVAPAGAILGIEAGVLRLHPLESPPERRTPIDATLHALAHDGQQTQYATAVVILSGEGSDGALGLKAVSDAGGVTFVQDPQSAAHESMPQGALGTGAADHVLDPARIGAELLAYAAHLREAAPSPGDLHRQVEDALPLICEVLLSHSGHNFKHYKTSTLCRRVLRRVQVLRLRSARAYLDHLRQSPVEAEQLFNDLLIGVTAFFRDPDAWTALSSEVLPRLFQPRAVDLPVRIWCAGCATGEEAYTLAMLVREQLDALKAAGQGVVPEVQIFATDIDQGALSVARQGVFPAGIAEEVACRRCPPSSRCATRPRPSSTRSRWRTVRTSSGASCPTATRRASRRGSSSPSRT